MSSSTQRIVAVGYDLIRPGKDYPSLFTAIKDASSWWWHDLDSTWIIKTSLTPAGVRDVLGKCIDKNDKLIVLELTGVAAWIGPFDQDAGTQLKRMLEALNV